MTAWSEQDLVEIGRADEIRIAPVREDGTLDDPRIIWIVRHDGDVYVRSVNGPAGRWFRGLQTRHAAHLWAGDIDADVTSEDADHGLDDEIDEAYRRKYGSSSSVDAMTKPSARSTTTRLVPR